MFTLQKGMIKKNMTSPEKVAEAKAEHFAHIIPPHSRQ